MFLTVAKVEAVSVTDARASVTETSAYMSDWVPGWLRGRSLVPGLGRVHGRTQVRLQVLVGRRHVGIPSTPG